MRSYKHLCFIVGLIIALVIKERIGLGIGLVISRLYLLLPKESVIRKKKR